MLGVVFASVRALLCRCYAPKKFQSVTEAATAAETRALALSLSLSFALSPLLAQHSGVVVVAVESVAAVSLLVYFAGVFFAAESEREQC